MLLSAALAAIGFQAPAAAAGRGSPSTPLVEDNRRFAVELHRHLASGHEGNLFISPASVGLAFGMVYAGAGGTTAEEIGRVLGFPFGPREGDTQFQTWMEDLQKEAPSDTAGLGAMTRRPRNVLRDVDPESLMTLMRRSTPPPYRLTIANALWAQEDLPVERDYVDRMRSAFRSDFFLADFAGRPAEARRRVNAWAEEKTGGLIPELLRQNLRIERTAVLLVDAVYFGSRWADPFPAASTKPEPFHLKDGGTVTCSLMTMETRARYAERGTFQLLEIPYQGNEASMLIALPRSPDGLGAAEESLAELLSSGDTMPAERRVRVFLPRLAFRTSLSLRETLQAMGIRDAFSAERADFAAIARAGLWISEVLHETAVIIDEEGTEAAAVTALLLMGEAAIRPEEPVVFRADRPFLFWIRHNPTGTILFLGRVTDPTEA